MNEKDVEERETRTVSDRDKTRSAYRKRKKRDRKKMDRQKRAGEAKQEKKKGMKKERKGILSYSNLI